jgi:glycosyltransferase involved in cell wall biosynthesis
MANVKLSILICSLHSRKDKFNRLIDILQPQLDKSKGLVQAVVVTDSGETPIGRKRNELMRIATGEYICFIDDDDTVADNYVELLLDAMIANTDIIVFDALRYVDNVIDKPVKYGIEYNKDYHDNKFYYRMPNHLMCVKKELALQVPFKEINFGEDSDYAKRLFPLLKTQARIDKILYSYLYTSKK